MTPGCAAVKSAMILLNADVREAAAKMFAEPEESGLDLEHLVVGWPSGELDHRALERSEKRSRDRGGGRAGRNRAVPAPCLDQAGDALDPALRGPLQPAANRMVPTAELHSKRHHHAGHIATAEDRMPARQGHELTDGIWLELRRVANLAPPVLVHPVDHRERQVLLVLELVVESAPGVSRIAGYLLEPKVAVAAAG